MKLWLTETGFLSHIWVNSKGVSKACYARCSSADELGTDLSSHKCPCGGVLRPEHPTDHASNYRCFLVSRRRVHREVTGTITPNLNSTEIFQMWPVWLWRVRMGGSRQVWIFACTLMKSWWFISGAPENVDILKLCILFFLSIWHSICTYSYEKIGIQNTWVWNNVKKLQISGVRYFLVDTNQSWPFQGGGTGRCNEKSTVQGRRLHAPPASDWVGAIQLFYSLYFIYLV